MEKEDQDEKQKQFALIMMMVCLVLLSGMLNENVFNHTDLVSFGKIKYNSNRTLLVRINAQNFRDIEENKVITIFDNITFLKISDLMKSENITRSEKVEILREHSKTPLCETGRIEGEKSFYCNLSFIEGGHLVIFPTTDSIGNFHLSIYKYYQAPFLAEQKMLIIYIYSFFIIFVITRAATKAHKRFFYDVNEYIID